MKSGMVVVAFASLVALCGAAIAQVEQRSNCRQPKLRERAYCLSKIEDESAITELLDVAKQMLLERYPSDQDFVYAAETAGLVAAKTKTDRLVLIVTKGDATAQRFGLVALRHTLSTLRQGYAQGGERDAAHRAKIVGPTGTVCRERLAATDHEVVAAAFGCLAETADTAHVPAIVKTTLQHDTHAQLAVAGVRALGELGGALAELRPLVRLLENPMPDQWLADDVAIRAETCRIFAGLVKETDRWVHLPAKTAAERIGNKSSQAREACEKLAARTSGMAIATNEKPRPSGRDWFTQSVLERCNIDRYGIYGTAELCVVSSPAAKGRSFEMRLADVSKLDPDDNTKHLAVLTTAIKVKSTQYVAYELVGSYELSDGFWLVVVPVVDGVPDRYSAKHHKLYLIDTANKRWTLAKTTKACSGEGCKQEVQLRRKKDQLPVDIHIEGVAAAKLTWNGRTLKR